MKTHEPDRFPMQARVDPEKKRRRSRHKQSSQAKNNINPGIETVHAVVKRDVFPRRKISTSLLVMLISIGAFTFFLRAFQLGRSYDIFIDEITYLRIAQSIANIFQVQLYGEPFFLHPPAYFFIEATYLKIVQPVGDTIQTIYSVRYLSVLIAAITAMLLFLIAFRAKGWLAGTIVVLLFGLNPFVIKLNSQNMLETPAIGFIIAGHWFLISGMKEMRSGWRPIWFPAFVKKLFPTIPVNHEPLRKGQDPGGEAEAVEPWRLILAGVFFGLALLMKETTGFLTIVPLAICFILNWCFRRRDVVWTILTSVLVYFIYPLIVLLSGQWSLFITKKLAGVLRFIGVMQTTGFNRPEGPSFGETLINRLGVFGTTYLMIALGAVAVLILALHLGKIARFIGIVTASAFGMMFYMIFLGTLEEHYFMYLVVPCILTIGIAFDLVYQHFQQSHYKRQVFAAALLLALLVTSLDMYQWVHNHTTPDNGYESVITYLRKTEPDGARVASTSETGQFLLGDDYLTGPWGIWSSVEELQKFSPEYLIVTPDSLVWNHGERGLALETWVAKNASLVYRFPGRNGNTIDLYRFEWSKGTQILKPELFTRIILR